MPIHVIDTGSSQRALDFGQAKREGFDACYVKLGGDNSGRYVAPYYTVQVDRARAAGMRVGHYWVPSNKQDPVAAADYFVNNVRGWSASDFAVLDNESLDGAVRYGDAQAAAWINRVKERLRTAGVFCYCGLADARGTAWPAVLGTGADFIIAAYSYAALQLPSIPTIPTSRIAGHQYGGRAIGGVVTDTNLFTDAAFNYAGTAGLDSTPILEEEDMPKAKLYRSDPANGGNGDMRIMNLETGFEFGIPSMEYLTLIVGWKLFDGVDSNAPINLPGNIHQFVRELCASARGGVTVDAGAIAASVGGQVTAAVKAALAEVPGFSGDVDAIAATVEARLADDFAKVNANIDDQPTTFEISPKG